MISMDCGGNICLNDMVDQVTRTVAESFAGFICIVLNIKMCERINSVFVVLISVATFIYLCLQIYKIYLQLKYRVKGKKP